MGGEKKKMSKNTKIMQFFKIFKMNNFEKNYKIINCANLV